MNPHSKFEAAPLLQTTSVPGPQGGVYAKQSKETAPRPGDDPLLGSLLASVSRAFYLSLRVLPHGCREPIALAYLLARSADSLADTDVVVQSDRLAALEAFVLALDGPSTEREAWLIRLLARLSSDPSLEAECTLLCALPQALERLDSLAQADASRVRQVVKTLVQGMQEDLSESPSTVGSNRGDVGEPRSPQIEGLALSNAAALDRYTYLVAGCVGEFWTQVTVAHVPALRRLDPTVMTDLGVRFGKALQLVNILRDLPGDLRRGRCYLPADELYEAGLEGKDLLALETVENLRPVMGRWISTALDHFDAAASYAASIPWTCLRLRLAVLWPILIGLKTLELLAQGLAEGRLHGPEGGPCKVGRSWVYRMLWLSVPASLMTPVMVAWMRRLARRVHTQVQGFATRS